jgi:hypothetical protein
VRVGGASKAELLRRLEAHAVRLNEHAQILFAKEWFAPAPVGTDIDTVEVSVADLGHGRAHRWRGSSTPRRHPAWPLVRSSSASTCGCSGWTSPKAMSAERRRAIAHRPASITVVSDPPPEADAPQGFYLRTIEGTPWLRGFVSGPDHVWSPDDRLVFAVRDRPV